MFTEPKMGQHSFGLITHAQIPIFCYTAGPKLQINYPTVVFSRYKFVRSSAKLCSTMLVHSLSHVVNMVKIVMWCLER